MPELPEVETTRLGLLPRLTGKRVDKLVVRDRRLRWPVPDGLETRLAGMTIETLHRRGKYLLLPVAKAKQRGHLLIHLGMTGTLRVVSRDTPVDKHDHVEASLSDGNLLRYRDPRRFGSWLWTGADWQSHPLMRNLGVEPLDEAFTGRHLWSAARGRRAPVKALIMDSHIVTGVGNIYANEALFRAGIRPAAQAGSVSLARYERLVANIREVLDEAIAAGGSSIRDYVGSDGAPGWFQLRYAVYGRAGEPCRSCGTPVRVSRDQQRATFHCPQCQKR